MKRYALLFLALFVASTSMVWAQGVSTLNGVVSTQDGQRLPGAVVTVTSPSLIGSRSVTTDAYGAYILKGLPPGDFVVTFEKSGMTTVQQKRSIRLNSENTANATLAIATRQETITVTAPTEAVVSNTQAGANYKGAIIDTLATGRTPAAIAELAPGVTDNTPNAGQVTISGSFAYDNVFLIDGVDVNDNLFGTPHNLFVEDAIDEQQVLTSGISAEYGRFSGGIINVVTKSGGNSFAGSFRTDFTNPHWQGTTPYEKANKVGHTSQTSRNYQATLGGYIIKDRLWFFTAGRRERSMTSNTLLETAIPYDRKVKNDRLEVKLTGNINPKNTLQATYMTNPTTQFNQPSLSTAYHVDPTGLIDRELPNNLFVANYRGVLKPNLSVEAQYSQKAFEFQKAGGTSTKIQDSPFFTQGALGAPASREYSAPFFSANDPEKRNNQQFSAAVSYFLSTQSMGRHDLKIGGEHYNSMRTGGNSQSSTGYVFAADYKTSGGKPVWDCNGSQTATYTTGCRLIPIFTPGLSEVWTYQAEIGAELDITTTSLYVNDRWHLNDKLSFNLGLRYEKATGKSSSGIKTANASALSPRLAVSFDPKGDGKTALQGTFAIYSGKFSDVQFGRITNVGNPSEIDYQYSGPAGEGLAFAPGFDLNNYKDITYGDFPLRNVFFDEDLSSPKTREFTLQAGRNFNKGYAKAIYTYRKTSNFIDDFITLDNGKTTVIEKGVDFGTFDNKVYRNTDDMKRGYQGLVFQAHYDFSSVWAIEGHYTLQLKNEGNFEGEAANQPGNPSLFGDFPEAFTEERNYPLGRIDDFQQHKIRVFTHRRFDLKRFGKLTPSFMYRFDSGMTYSHTASSVPLTTIQKGKLAGYAVPPSTQTLYFGERGSQSFKGFHVLDMAWNYELPVWKTLRPYVKFDVRNALNNKKQIAWNTTVTRDTASALDANGLPTGYIKGANYSKATSTSHYPYAREYRFALGFRF